VTLPRQTGNEDDFFHETMALGQEESSFDCARDSQSSRRDFVVCSYSDSRFVDILFQETRL
jgi:hypothetical protein